MSNLEKEFFEAMGIGQKRISGAEKRIFGDNPIFFRYPLITANIVLGLEEIIKSPYYLLLKNRQEMFEYILFKYDGKTPEYGLKEITFCERKTRKECLLQLFINLNRGHTTCGYKLPKLINKKKVQSLFTTKNKG